MARTTCQLGGATLTELRAVVFAMDSLQLEDDFNDCVGKQVTTLFEVWGYDETHKGHRCRTALRGTLFRFSGYIPRESTVFLAIGAEVTKKGNALSLQLPITGSLHSRPPMELKNITKVIETCSGIGCLGKGLVKAGFQVVLRNDFNAPLLGLSQQIGDGPVVLGDICEDSTLAQICSQVPYSCTTAAGVSCQPHSKLGDKKGSKDERAATLPRTLKTAFLTRQLAIILECVEDIQQSDWAQSVIQAFAAATGYRVTQGTLHLQHIWPTRRSRWWCILTHKMLGKVSWIDFPMANPKPMVIDVLPEFKHCTDNELKQLKLDDYELGKFNHAGLANNLIPTKGVMKTSLHSCGSQLSACACGCRKFPFGEERLNNGGLHGHLVKLGNIANTAVGPIPECRHVHPAELAILNGMFCDYEWGPNLKLALSGLGQLASPLQAVWVGSLLMQHCVTENILQGESVDPKEVLLGVMEELLMERDKFFGPPTTTNAKNFQKWVKQGLIFRQPPVEQPEIVQMHPIQQSTAQEVRLTTIVDPAQTRKEDTEEKTDGKIDQDNLPDQWVCDYLGCPVCDHPKTNLEEKYGIKDNLNFQDMPEISPTIQFVAQSQNSEEEGQTDKIVLQASIEAEQHLKLKPPPSNGGIIGFETHRGTQRARPDQRESPKELAQVVAREELTIRPETHQTETKLETDENQQKIDKHPTIKFRLLMHPEAQPCVIESSVTTTPAQVLTDLRKTYQLHDSIVLRTGVATHWPLHEPILQGQFVRVENLANEVVPKCAKQGRNQKPTIDFPIDRLSALWKQKSWVAQDEFEFYLKTLDTQHQVSTFPSIVIQDETESDVNSKIDLWLKQGIEATETHHRDTIGVSAVIWKEHWIPIAVQTSPGKIDFTIPPGNGDLEQHINQWSYQTCLEVEIHHKMCAHRFAGDCGFQSFAWLVAIAQGSSSFNQQESLSPHQAEFWRNIFEQHLIQSGKALVTINHICVGGAKPEELKEQLQQLLSQHGVWQDRVEERTTHILNHISMQRVKGILNSPRPWQDLKQAANASSPPIKLIMSDELNAQIKARLQTTNRVGTKGRKTNNQQQSVEQIKIEAADLEIPTGVFRQAHGPVLGNIDIQQIGPNAAGVVIVDPNQAEAILRLKQPVTQNGLAIIVLANKSSSGEHTVPVIRFPAMYQKTQEPIIISGFMYQLGKHQVIRHEPQEKLAIDFVQAEALRCLVFKDQAGALWEKMEGHPVKTVFEAEPLLVSKNDEGQNIVIDVWDRQWYTKRFEKTKSQSAELFAFSFRVVATEVDTLLESSGTKGFYFEPRSACGRQPNESYQVTWLPHSSFHEAKYAQQTSPQRTSLVRHGDRYGLRSDTLHAKQIHEHHRPDTPFLMGGTKMLYSLGPLPYSTTRESITKLMKVWQWEGRPLQPRGRSADGSGVNWTIQATSDPSHFVYQLQHGDVLITKAYPKKAETKDSTLNIVASKKTIEQLQQSEAVDPLWQQDPWKQYKPTASVAAQAPAPAITQAQLAKIEENVARKVQAGLPTKDDDTPMTDAHTQDRISQLENQIQSVTTQQKHIEDRIGNMQHQLDQQGVQFKQTLEQQLGDQMSRIEALLVKRVRHE